MIENILLLGINLNAALLCRKIGSMFRAAVLAIEKGSSVQKVDYNMLNQKLRKDGQVLSVS